MKILVISLDGVDPDVLLGDERLATIRSLMEAGSYGRFAGHIPADSAQTWMILATGREPGPALAPTIWAQVVASGGRSILVGFPAGEASAQVEGLTVVDEASGRRFDDVRDRVADRAWEYLQVVETVPIVDEGLDDQIAKVLEALTEETLILVASSRGAFILAAPHLPAFGEIDDARWIDLAPTLLELAGLPPLPDCQGRNILAGRSPIDGPPGGAMDDDELVRERLRGLGYIG